MPTIKDVARLAGVSVATVSRVLNNKGYVNTDTKQKVDEAIAKLQYRPNVVARGLAGKKTGTIALILPDISNPFFPEMARGVEDVASDLGYTVILCNSDDQGDKEKSYIEILKQKFIDGLIFASHTLQPDDIKHISNNGIAMVVLDRAPAADGYCLVRSRNQEGAKLAVQHLLDIGCQKIAHIYGPRETITAQERLMGYEEMVKDLPWYSPSLMVPGNFSIDGGALAVEQLLERHPDVDGIFAANDLMAVGALKRLMKLGIRVPDQMALCGFDGINLTEIIEPELSTIAQPIYDMGATAARLLINKIEGKTLDDQVVEMDVQLLTRQSTNRKGR